jgi:hypothetical protein
MVGNKSSNVYYGKKNYIPDKYKTSKRLDSNKFDYAIIELDVDDLSDKYGYIGVDFENKN